MNKKHLIFNDRFYIEKRLAANAYHHEIAHELGIHLATIRREIRRNTVEHVFFDEGSDDFFVDLDGAREANRFTHPSFNAGTERQVIALYALREELASQMFLLRHLSWVMPLNSWLL